MSTILLPPLDRTVRYAAKFPLVEGLKLTVTVISDLPGIDEGRFINVNGPTRGPAAVLFGVTVVPPSET